MPRDGGAPAALLQTCASICGSGVAYSVEEQIYFAANVIIGAIVQATIFGSVAGLLHSLNEDQSAFEHKCDLVQVRGLPFFGIATL